MTTIDAMYDLGIQLVDEVSSTVINLSQTRDLGSEIGGVGVGGDKTKIADDASEVVVKKVLVDYQSKNPDVKIVLIAEETGVTVFGPEDSHEGFFVILDPMDGSNNLRPWKSPAPLVAVSVAFGRLGTLMHADNFDAIEVGIVKDIFNNRTFVGTLGEKSHVLEYGEISASPTVEIEQAIMGIDFDVQGDKFDLLYPQLRGLLKACKCQRRIGSSILDFMKVASGEYDAFVTIAGRMKIYDVAAAQLIIKGAGGQCHYLEESNGECLIKKLITSKDNSLLGKNTFKVISTGRSELLEAIVKSIDVAVRTVD